MKRMTMGQRAFRLLALGTTTFSIPAAVAALLVPVPALAQVSPSAFTTG